MKKLLIGLLCLLTLAAPAHAQKTKAQLTTEINTNFPDNTTGLITPSILRSTVIDMVNSWYGLVDTSNSGTSSSSFQQLLLNGATSGTISILPQANTGTYNFNMPTTPGTAGQVMTSQGGGSNVMTWTGPLFSGIATLTSVGNPAGTTSLSLVMQGNGSVCTITPTKSTKVAVVFTGNISNNTANDGAVVAAKFGTGTAPVNGAANTGSTASGNMFLTNNANTAGMTVSLTVFGIATSLTLNTAYWFDIAQEAITGGTAAFQNVNCVLYEF